ncbi:venom protein 302-like [Hydractinia symbiolongicarpus]|uniref:venom protein 302-like n=1 Tax=Hydractinia symbiolongicarpus TaxID=13093 RepID=UPI0025506F14|nr:venom protein 302-like [Hydractinia symbiolongicarpus]XP_057290528.1 venom protein 302-like [Hydractinia symbiolongicarpus]
MNIQSAYPFILFLVTLIHQTETLSCDCEKRFCRPIGVSECKGGVTKDTCGCCYTCAKIEGEECGGMWKIKGNCDKGLYCEKKRKDKGGYLPVEHSTGKCMLDPNSVERYDWNFWRDFFGKKREMKKKNSQ